MNETSTDPEQAHPIDAEFETVDTGDQATSDRPAPGWIAFGMLGLVSLVSLIFAISASGSIFGGSTGSAPGDTARLEDEISSLRAEQDVLLGRIDGLEARVSELSTGVEEAGGNRAPSPAIVARLDRLESRIASVSETDGTASETEIAALRAQINGLETRLANVSNQPVSAPSNTAAMALMAINTEAARGRPFLLGYQQLLAAMPEDRRILGIETYARSGVPTVDQLVQDFKSLRDAALAADTERSNPEPGWVDQVFGDSVRIRRTSATPLSDTLSTAEQALEDGNLTEAIAALDSLSDADSERFSDWIGKAQDRLDLDQRLDSIRLAVVSRGQP